MKLVNADAAKDFWSGDHPTAVAMRNIFDSLPAVDAVEVVHGRWIGKNSPYDANIHICSVCREQISILGNKLRYCPNCGAKMDGDGNE